MMDLGALASVVFEVARWWLVVQLMALAVLPLVGRLLGNLSDRGYVFAKALGLLAVGYALWILATLGLVSNSPAAIALITLAVGLLAWSRLRSDGVAVAGIWRQRRGLVVHAELLFLCAFLIWAFVRAAEPDIVGTEKPMEFAFLNAIMRSERFPPADPWLSGHSISYYYFGYLVMGTVAKLAGTPSAVAFNLSVALLFALTALGAFGLVYNLVAAARPLAGRLREKSAEMAGLVSAYLVVVLGNLMVIVEILNVRGVLTQEAWRWLHIKDLPPPSPGSSSQWLPTDWMWWFRSSRVIGTFDPETGRSLDYTINEFPFFSFLLGDLHPHVLALPFVLLALSLALNLILGRKPAGTGWLSSQPHLMVAYGVIIGGLAFTNSWDLPTFLFVLVAALGVQRYLLLKETPRKLLRELLGFGGLLLILSLILYLPFYVGFRSQTSGIGVVEVRSKLHHFAIFWAPLLFLTLSLVAREVGIRKCRFSRKLMAPVASWLVVLLLVAAVGATTLLLLLVLLGLTVLALFLGLHEGTEQVPAEIGSSPVGLTPIADAVERELRDGGELRARLFVLLLAGTGVLLLAGCEVFFVRDLFGNRMNTVFKLYYQAWVLLALCGGYVLYSVAFQWRRSPVWWVRATIGAWLVAALVLIGAGSVYPLTASAARTNPQGTLTLDGTARLAAYAPAEYEAMIWLKQNAPPTAVVVEAAGGSYSAYGRVSANTGIPTLVGWDFHETQWRGTPDEAMRRKADVETIYVSPDKNTVQALLSKYGVKYVYVGPLEEQTYGQYGWAALDKFGAFMDLVYANSSVKIYQVRDYVEAVR